MRSFSCLALIALLLVGSSDAVSQPRVAGAPVLEEWVAQQRRAFAALEQLRMYERSEQEVEGPYHRRLVRYEHDVTVRQRQVTRELRRATVDGEAADADKAEHQRRRLTRALGEDYAAARRLADAPAYHLGRLDAVQRIREDRVDGRAVWRVDLRARADEAPIDRATLWFSRDARQPILIESRINLRGADPANEVTLRTSYAAVDGPAGPLAVPRRQTVEATVQQVRRWRTFTVVVYSVREASQIEASWRPVGGRTGQH